SWANWRKRGAAPASTGLAQTVGHASTRPRPVHRRGWLLGRLDRYHGPRTRGRTARHGQEEGPGRRHGRLGANLTDYRAAAGCAPRAVLRGVPPTARRLGRVDDHREDRLG